MELQGTRGTRAPTPRHKQRNTARHVAANGFNNFNKFNNLLVVHAEAAVGEGQQEHLARRALLLGRRVHASDVRVRLQHLQRESVSADAQVGEGRKILTGLMLQHINGFEVATYERFFLL